jgi:four helix bundle protein
MPTSQGFRGLRVYQLAFRLAMEIYNESKHFPAEEKYSLTDQIRRASRSVATNIGEGYRRSSIQRCLLARCQMPMARQQKRRSG